MPSSNRQSRRDFLQTSGAAGAGAVLAADAASSANAASATNGQTPSRGLAGRELGAELSPWDFSRRPVGDNDVLIDVKYCGVCHSDIHQMRGHWGPQQLPQVPGHEVAGIIAAVG